MSIPKLCLRKLLAALVLVCMASMLPAQLRLAGIFTDHMVLQREKAVPVWGWAAPGTSIHVRFGAQSVEAISDKTGKWTAILEPMEASARGEQLLVSSNSGSLEINDILVGEVWLCSGQSNMGASLVEADDSERVVAEADKPLIRVFKVPQRPALEPCPDVEASWVVAHPSKAKGFSAMAYHLAIKLQEELQVPVGVVVCAWGGSSVLAWMSEQALDGPLIQQHFPYDLIGYFENHRPRLLFNGMLHPLIPFAFKGVVWYQGETDAMDERFNPYLYRKAFAAMIVDWRSHWKQENWPFYFVQLPNLMNGKWWPILRESQDQVHRTVPNTGMITTIDIGQSRKLHPSNKVQFAGRMADLILSEQYEVDRAATYPEFQTFAIKEGKVTISFGEGTTLKTVDGQPPRAFEMAGADQVFHPASAQVDRHTIILQSEKVPAPVAVRYAFVPDPPVNLVNDQKLPLRPFRTDDWPVPGSQIIQISLPEKGALAERCNLHEMVKGESTPWQWIGTGSTTEALVQDRSIQLLANDKVKLRALGRRDANFKKAPSPVIAWNKPIQAPQGGITLEVDAHLFRTNIPYEGFSLQAGIVKAGQLLNYRVDFSPLMVTAFKDDLISVLARDLDNMGFHKYRLAIREDGTCQVYYDQRLIGMLAPEIIEDQERVANGSFLRFGKLQNSGDITLDIAAIKFDLSGAYAPANQPTNK